MPTENITLENSKFGDIKWKCLLDISDIPTKKDDIKVKAEKSVLKITGKSTFDIIKNGFKMRCNAEWGKDVQLPADYGTFTIKSRQ